MSRPDGAFAARLPPARIVAACRDQTRPSCGRPMITQGTGCRAAEPLQRRPFWTVVLAAVACLAVACGVALTVGVANASAQGVAAVSPPGEVSPAGTFVQRVPVDVPSYHGLEPSIG